MRTRTPHGFSLLEVTTAMGIMMIVTAGVFSLMHPAHGAFAAQPEVADLQQRLRVAVDTLSRDLIIAGAGASLGAQAGPLVSSFAPVLPFRQGATNDDPPGTFATDRITLISVPSTAAQARLTTDFTPASPALQVAAESSCSQHVNLCAFAKDMPVLVYDDQGSYDLFTITSVVDGLMQLTVNKPADAVDATFLAGATVVEAASHTYYVKTDATTGLSQLMHYDGTRNADVPVVDHLVGLAFEYFGEPIPPLLTKPVSDPAGPWTTYGPKPPALGVKPTAYPAGENCAFTIDGNGQQVSRLAVLGGGSPALVPLTSAQLTDGPWCPDQSRANRWDADLLRIRTVAVTLRVETASAALRGPASALFSNGGTSRGGSTWVPDQELRFELAPRNLNFGR